MRYFFGSLVPNRHRSTDDYRYGFQGQEKDDELKGEGNSLNYTFRMHDPRVGRFLSLDPLAPKFPWNSPFSFSENRVIDMLELEGAETKPSKSNSSNVVETTKKAWKWLGEYFDALLEEALPKGRLNKPGQSLSMFQEPKQMKKEIEDDAKAKIRKVKVVAKNPVKSAKNVITAVIDKHVNAYRDLKSGNPKRVAQGTIVVAPLLIPLVAPEAEAITLEETVGVSLETRGAIAVEEGVALSTEVSLSKEVEVTIKSFDDLVNNPKEIWGKSVDDVEQILGSGWERQALNSGEGWKFIEKGGDGFVSFTTGNSHHPGSTYYKINSGKYGKTKVVGKDYKPTKDDKSKIIQAE